MAFHNEELNYYKLDANDLGFCIENKSPYQQSVNRCDCYKTFIPYNIMGESGVIFVCREWVNYLMLFGDRNEAIGHIKVKIEEFILNKYPVFKDVRVEFTKYSWGYTGSSMEIVFQITPDPFPIFVSMQPSFFIEKYAIYTQRSTWHLETIYDLHTKINKGLAVKVDRMMKDIFHENIKRLDYWIDSKGRVKKHQKLIETILQTIKQTENENK
jgi:hypothetical protein